MSHQFSTSPPLYLHNQPSVFRDLGLVLTALSSSLRRPTFSPIRRRIAELQQVLCLTQFLICTPNLRSLIARLPLGRFAPSSYPRIRLISPIRTVPHPYKSVLICARYTRFCICYSLYCAQYNNCHIWTTPDPIQAPFCTHIRVVLTVISISSPSPSVQNSPSCDRFFGFSRFLRYLGNRLPDRRALLCAASAASVPRPPRVSARSASPFPSYRVFSALTALQIAFCVSGSSGAVWCLYSLTVVGSVEPTDCEACLPGLSSLVVVLLECYLSLKPLSVSGACGVLIDQQTSTVLR